MKRLVLAAVLIGLFAVQAAAGASAWAPPAESLRFGRTPTEVTRRLGAPSRRWNDAGFSWLAYSRCHLTLGFYRDRLGRMTLTPRTPMPRRTALAWAAAFLPGFKEARVAKEGDMETFFQQFTVDGHPFEGYVTLHMAGDKVARLEGEMSWLD